MARLYDTAAFLRLKEAVCTHSSTDGLPLPTIEALAGLRAAARDADPAAFHRLCWQVWDTLAAPDASTSKLGLPPCYRTKGVTKEVEWAARHLWNLEHNERQIGDHGIYCGVKGTGKTTLLMCIGAMAAVLLDKTFPIYWSYELLWTDRTPAAAGAAAAAAAAAPVAATAAAAAAHADAAGASHGDAALAGIPTIQALLRHAATLASGTAAAACIDSPDICDALEQFMASASTPRYPLLLIDEFTELYYADSAGATPTPREHLLQVHGSSIMRNLHTLGKTRKEVFCLLAASKTDLNYYMHPDRAPRELAGYPNVNNTVFKRREVLPIRDAATLSAYVAARFGVADVDGDRLLDATGGVGRDVAVYMTNPLATPDVTVDHIIDVPDLFALFSVMLAHVPWATLSQPHWPVVGIPFQTAEDVLTRRGTPNAARVITRWCDSMVLLRSEGRVEVLVPARLREFHARVEAAKHLRAALELSWTVHGFAGGSASASSESLICQFIHSRVGADSSSTDTLKLDGGVATLTPTDDRSDSAAADGASGGVGTAASALATADGASGGAGTAASALAAAGGASGGAGTAASALAAACGCATGGAGTASAGVASRSVAWRDLLGRVLRWRHGGKEVGIDRIWLTLLNEGSASANPIVRLDFLQLKTGKAASEFDKGQLDTERARPTSSISRDTFAGILVKAERGLALLLPALVTCFPDVTWSLGTFWIFSSKQLQPAAVGFAAENPKDCGAFRIRRAEASVIRKVVGKRLEGPLEFGWRVEDGVSWLRSILPREVAALI